MTVLVTGLRGAVGRRVAAELLAQGEDVRGASLGGQSPAGLDVPTVALDLHAPDDLAPALDGVDQVFLYAAAEAIEPLVAAFRDAGVARVVVLSSASVELEGGSAIGRHHAVVEEAVAGSGVPWTFLRPNAFATNTLAWAAQVRSGRLAIPFPDAYVEPIHEADLADAAVAALTDPRHEGRAYYLTGPESLSQREQAAQIAAAVGHAVDVVDLPVADWRAQLLERGTPPAFVDTLVDLWADTDRPGPCDRTLRDVTGAAPRTFAQWALDHRGDFA